MQNKHIVIIPVYNEVAIIKKMLSAFLKNTNLKKCSVHIIDDGSDKATIKYLEKISQENSGICLHKNQKNIGKPKSVNKIIHENQDADFFTIIDSDIKIASKNWQETLLKAHKIFNNKTILGAKLQTKGFEFKKNGLMFGDTFPFWTLGGGFFSIPKFVFNKLGYFYDEIKRHEDADYCRRAATQNIPWYYIANIKVQELRHKSYSTKKEYQKLKAKEEAIYKKRSAYIMTTHNVYYNPFKKS